MIETQIQVPEELLQELRRIAKHREWSLSETFRRGAELLLQVYPDLLSEPTKAWTLPASSRVGWEGLSAEQLRDATFAE